MYDIIERKGLVILLRFSYILYYAYIRQGAENMVALNLIRQYIQVRQLSQKLKFKKK